MAEFLPAGKQESRPFGGISIISSLSSNFRHILYHLFIP